MADFGCATSVVASFHRHDENGDTANAPIQRWRKCIAIFWVATRTSPPGEHSHPCAGARLSTAGQPDGADPSSGVAILVGAHALPHVAKSGAIGSRLAWTKVRLATGASCSSSTCTSPTAAGSIRRERTASPCWRPSSPGRTSSTRVSSSETSTASSPATAPRWARTRRTWSRTPASSSSPTSCSGPASTHSAPSLSRR